MGMPNGKVLEIPNDGAGNAVVGTNEYHVTDLVGGYDYTLGAGKAFTGALEGSVSGQNWTAIDDLTASGQGEVGAHYHYIRVSVTGAGALGTGTEIQYMGKS